MGSTVVAVVLLFFQLQTPPIKHIVLVSIDTLRADRLGCYGYEKIRTPNIDLLADEGVLFENAATATPLTQPAHSSIFTGRSPLRHGVIDNFGFRLDGEEVTLAEVLKESGYATGGFVAAFVLDSRWGIAQGFDTYFDQFETSRGKISTLEANQRPGDQVLKPALEWIRSQGDRPFFAFVHFFDPHTPYDPPEPYRSEYGPAPKGLYDGEVAFVDSLVGRLVATLKDQGIYENTLIVLFGDHGESLGDHGEVTHGFFIYDATIRIPLLIKAPGGRAGSRVKAQVRSIDVMPTVLDLVGIPAPESVEGVSLGSLLQDPDEDPALLAYVESHYAQLHFGWAPLRGIRSDRYKFIEAPQPELYDLVADPDEANNLISERAGTVRQLASSLEQLVRAQPSQDLTPTAVDPETEQRLRALGYVTASAAPSSSQNMADLPDPKEKIDLFNRFAEAAIKLQTGEVERSRFLLRSLLEEDPDVLLAYWLLGNNHLRRREFLEAAAVFRSGLARNDESLDGVYGLGLAYKGLGRLEQAAAGFAQCLTIDPGQVRATYQLAEVRMEQGRPEEAERLLREGLELQSETSLRLLLADALLAQGKTEEALAALRRAERDDPDSSLTPLSLGNMLIKMGEVNQAMAAYRRAESLAPEEARIQNAIGNGLARQGDVDGAIKAFQRAAALEPSFAAAHNNLGIALANTGRAAEAEKAFRLAIETDPDYAQAYNNLGYLYLQVGATKDAIPLFRRALALKPDYTQARSNLEAAWKRR